MPSALKVDQLGGANFGNYHLRNVASLHVGGSALATAILDVSGSKTADAGSAIGQNNTTTLVAAANNDILTAVRIAPTFTNGAFTGVKNKALWIVSGLTDLDGDLEVAGTADFVGTVTIATLSSAATTITGVFTHNASVTATSGAARSMLLTPTLTAAANNDTLTAVRIAPTFTPGAFTGVTQRALEVVSGTTSLQALEVTTVVASGLITGNAGITATTATVDGAVTATAGVARSTVLSPTLTAAANGDALTALRIAPTFTVGAFTGVTQTALEVTVGGTTLQTLTTAGLITASAGITLGTSQRLTFGDGSFMTTASAGADETLDYAWTGTHTWSKAIGLGIAAADISPWAPGLRAIESGYGALALSNASSWGTHYNWNAYYDTDWKYRATDEASDYYQLNGAHVFRVAGSGTADTAITWNNVVTIHLSGSTPVMDAAGNRFFSVSSSVSAWQQGSSGSYVQLANAESLKPGGDNLIACGYSGARWTAVWAVNGTIQTSARHFKDLKRTLSPEEGMEAIATLPVYEYTRKNENTLRRFGPVLDEMPEYLRPNEDGETWVEGNLLAFNTLAIQDLNKRVSALEMLAA